MKKKTLFILVIILGLNTLLFAQYINRNEYIKVYNDLYVQYSPKVMGWQLFKYDSYRKTYEHLIYKDSKSEKEYPFFKNIYVVEPYLLFTKEGGLYKQLSVHSDYKVDDGVQKIFFKDDHPVEKTTSGKYYSLVDPPVESDTFAIINSQFYASLNKKDFQEDEYIFTNNGFIVPLYYGYTNYNYLIKKNNSGYQLANTKIISTITPNYIHAFDEPTNSPDINKQFDEKVKLSYYTGNEFLISEKGKWYICNLPLDKEKFKTYLKSERITIPKNDESFSYFGDLDAESIKIISWRSSNPKLFIARVKNKDYIFDYERKLVSRGGKKIQFEPINGIQGDFIKPHYSKLDFNKVNNVNFIEVRNKDKIEYYRFNDNGFTKLSASPFRNYTFSTAFIDSKYLVSGLDGELKTEKEFRAKMTQAEIEEENKFLLAKKRKDRTERLKTAFINFRFFQDLKTYFTYPNFPQKYINGEQWIVNKTKNHLAYSTIYILDSKDQLIQLPKRHYEPIFITDASNRKIQISVYNRELIPNINGTYFQSVGTGESSYENRKYITIETFSKKVQESSVYLEYIGCNMIEIADVFQETQQHINIEDEYAYRLSNNDILLILKIELKYLSGQLNRMFGIDGYNNISRTFDKANYWKFITLSSDGSELKSVNNYLLPIDDLYFSKSYKKEKDHIKLIDGGFLIYSENLGEIIKLNKDDFGIKRSIYSADAGKNIIVTENINFDKVTSSEKGIRIFKFNNDGEVTNQLTIGNPNDPNIIKPNLLYFCCSENYICISYLSYELNVINRATEAYDLYDTNLNLIERKLYKAQYFRDYDLPSNAGIVSLNDTFYYYNGRRAQNNESIDFFKLPTDLFKIEFEKLK